MYLELEQLLEQLSACTSKILWKYYYKENDLILTEAYPCLSGEGEPENIVIALNQLTTLQQPVHRHESFVINYLCSGCAVIDTAHEQLVMQPGDVYVSQPHTPYSCRAQHSDVPSQLISVFIRKELLYRVFLPLLPDSAMLHFFIQPYSEPYSENYLMIADCAEDEMQRTFLHLLREYIQQPLFYVQLLECTLVTYLGLITRRSVQMNATHRENSLLVQDVLKYISNHCDTVTLQDAARTFNYNTNYFSSLIRRETNQCFSQLVRNCRLQKAQNLLYMSDLPVTKISKLTGYSHPSNFYKVFKSEYGVSPAEFRRTCRPA